MGGPQMKQVPESSWGGRKGQGDAKLLKYFLSKLGLQSKLCVLPADLY